jgi:cis-L-3-hydroxyproline dehydratase
MFLTRIDQEMLDGGRGEAVRMAMAIIVRMGELTGAEKLIDIRSAHIDSTIYTGQATLDFAERLSGLGARVSIPSTSNVSGIDEFNWQQWPVPVEWASGAVRQMNAYEKMGCVPTFTCAPYQTQYRPTFGEQIAWGESNAIAFANSVIGARTERYPDLLDICVAITGRAPLSGLHLDENRGGQVLLKLADIPLEMESDPAFYPVLGILAGRLAGVRIPVIDRLRITPGENDLKALGASMASAGGVALFHLVGITPEAPSLEKAFLGRRPEETIEVTGRMLGETLADLNTAHGEALDLVALGCPHFSLDEFKTIMPWISGKKRHPNVRFLIASNRGVVRRAREAGYVDEIRRFGGEIVVDTCILTSPMLSEDVRTIMTPSGKYAYYAPGLLGRKVYFGNLEACVRAARTGTADLH